MEDRLKQSAALRRKAEAIAPKETPSSEKFAALPPDEIQKTFHELRDFQLELEMQNEELRRTQVELAAEKERYFNLYDLAPEGYCTTSDKGLILTANLTAAAMLGVSRGSLIKQRISCLIINEDQNIYYLNRKRLVETGEPQTCELRLLRQGKDVFWVKLKATLVPDSNGAWVHGVMMSDINERKQAEDALRKSEEKLKLANELLQAAKDDLEWKVEQRTHELQVTQQQVLHAEKLSAIGKLSASIAHEFNNPLQGLLSILQGVRKRAIMDEEDRELLDAAISEGNRMKALIRSLQDFNRPSSDKQVMMDLHQSLDSLLLMHRSEFKGRRISVVCNYAKKLSQIMAISDQIKQVFLNLLANAADACDHDGGVITVSTWQDNGRVAVRINDTGIGIKPEDMDQIFHPFYSTKGEVKGTGLGLSVSLGIIQKHEGEIRVESQPGKGATFTVLLPIKGINSEV